MFCKRKICLGHESGSCINESIGKEKRVGHTSGQLKNMELKLIGKSESSSVHLLDLFLK